MASTISAGTSTGTALNLVGDTSGALALQTNNGTTALTIDTSQNVGIGTATPVTKLNISGSSAASGELGTLAISGSTTSKRLAIGVDSSGTMYSWIQSIESGVGYKDLSLQPLGANVGIGTATPDKILGIFTNDSSTTTVAGIGIRNYNSTGGTRAGILFSNFDNAGASIWSPRTGAVTGALCFGTNGGGGTPETNIVERVRINSTGNVVLQGGTAAATGVGITFPSTQSASTDANCLDDYEEGTFTPSFLNTTATYVAQAGWYTKIGNTVYFNINIQTATLTQNANNIVIGGLPFTVLSASEYYPPTANFMQQGFSKTGITGYQNLIQTGQTTVAIWGFLVSSGTNYVNITYNDIQATANWIRLSGTYIAA